MRSQDPEDNLLIKKLKELEGRHERDEYEIKIDIAGVDVVLLNKG